jgi:transcriptional regulator with XRE-family HTH domain
MTIKTKTPQGKSTRRLFQNMRNSFGLSVAEAAHRANISMDKLNKWEQGARKLKLEELSRLAALMVELQDRPDSGAILERVAEESGGAAAREYREMHGIAQAEVARAMKLAPTTVCLFEKGYLRLTENQVAKLGKVLDKLKKLHAQTANELKLFREIEASLRRELAEKEAELAGGNQEATASEGGMMKLSALRGREK